jgi:hypothetical protein
MKSINVEVCIGHNIGVSKSYYKPTTKEVLEDYMKAIDLLTINTESRLSKQVEKLAEKDRESQYIIQAKLQEKDDALVTLSDQVMKLSNEIDLLKNKIRI